MMPLFFARKDATKDPNHTFIELEHLANRGRVVAYNTSHMGRIEVTGLSPAQIREQLQRILIANVHKLDEDGRAQYTAIPTDEGALLDDSYLSRLTEGRYILVVNAGHLRPDLEWLRGHTSGITWRDVSDELAMIAVQGPHSPDALQRILEMGFLEGSLPIRKNDVSILSARQKEVIMSRTGYTGEPYGYEVMIPREHAVEFWEMLLEFGAKPAGLGARDSTRAEAGLPLGGQEFLGGPDGRPIPAFAVDKLRPMISPTAPGKEDMPGMGDLRKQYEAFCAGRSEGALPYVGRSFVTLNSARDGPGTDRVRTWWQRAKPADKDGQIFDLKGNHIGWVTTQVMAAYHEFDRFGSDGLPTGATGNRVAGIAYVRTDIPLRLEGVPIEIWGRKQNTPALLVDSNGAVSGTYFRPRLFPEART